MLDHTRYKCIENKQKQTILIVTTDHPTLKNKNLQYYYLNRYI